MNAACSQAEAVREQPPQGRPPRRRWCAFLLAIVCAAPLRAEVTFTSPELDPSRMDDQGRLVKYWGSIMVNVAGAGLTTTAPPKVSLRRKWIP